jgi:hypothetical protein
MLQSRPAKRRDRVFSVATLSGAINRTPEQFRAQRIAIAASRTAEAFTSRGSVKREPGPPFRAEAARACPDIPFLRIRTIDKTRPPSAF